MGKSRKRSRHFNTGYPYNPIRVAHIHVVRPKVRHDTDSSLFIGEGRSLDVACVILRLDALGM